MLITSRQNPLIVRLAKLADRKHRKTEGLFLAEGVKLSYEAAKAGVVEYLLVTEENLSHRAVEEAEQCGCEIITVSREVLEKVSTESAPQGMIAVCRMMPELHSAEAADLGEGECVLILDRVRDPGNMGTIMRSAEAFGAALDNTAVKLGEYSLTAKDAVIIGTEGQGISAEILDACDGKLYIPMTGGESLNCSVAASVIMWETFRSRNL